tara:strand:+ start:419 stop:892 length:474 start_codon:yes stop_codon:yes gene_type:complete
MVNTDLKLKENIRHISIRKKTASRICSIQVLYSFSFFNDDIDLLINNYIENYLPKILKDLSIKKMDYELFEIIITGVHKNILKIDEIISKNLSSSWSIDRLSQTEKTILRSATYELLFENKFKKLTIMNEYISIFEVFGGNADFANGILDNISKEIK